MLEREGIAFRVLTSHIEEARRDGEPPIEYARRLAREKAQAVHARLGRQDGKVLAADTIVVADDHVLEKPRDVADAERMLRMLSGRPHEVTTAVCLLHGGREDVRHATTVVRFRALSDAEIRAYVETSEPFDKAGAYGIQGGAAKFVESMEGDYDNVVGLPMFLVKEMLGV